MFPFGKHMNQLLNQQYQPLQSTKLAAVGVFLLSSVLLIPFATLSAEPRSGTQVKVLTFYNPSSFQRDEIVEVKGSELCKALGVKAGTSVVVKDKRGNEVISQWEHDGNLLVDVFVRPLSTTTYTVAVGQPSKYRQWVYGRLVPERKDDIAWENDRGAYRIYGPALEKTGERSFGTDVWVKNTPDLVINDRYL